MPGRTGSPELLLDTISNDDKEVINQIHQRREDFVDPLWEEYERGAYRVVPDDQPETTIKLIKSADLRVERRDNDSKNGFSVSVAHVGAQGSAGVNFMGYDVEQRCLAFRGEARHLDSFLDFSNWMIEGQRAMFVFKAHSETLIPTAGLKKGLCYDDFASQVEIVEYTIWLKAPIPDEEADSSPMDELVMLSPGEDPFLEDTQPVSHAATHSEGEELRMDVDGNIEPAVPNGGLYSTDSSLSDIPEEVEPSSDGCRQSDAANIADQDHEMMDGSAFEAGPCTHHDNEEANKLASQLEADAALAASLSESLANTNRYTLRRRSSTKDLEELSKAEQKNNLSISKNTEGSKENAECPRATSAARQPAKRSGKKTDTGLQTRKNKPRRQ